MARILKVDFTGVESGGGRPHIPEGDYGVEITKILAKKGEDSGKPYLEFKLKVIKGPKRGIGKVLTDTASMQKQSLWHLRQILESCGLSVPSKAVKIDIDKLIGKKMGITATDDEYEGKKKSIVGAVFPFKDLGKTSDDGDDLEEATETEEEEEEESGEESEEESGEEEVEEEEEEAPKSKKGKKGVPPKKKGKAKPKDEDEEEESGEEEEAESLFN